MILPSIEAGSFFLLVGLSRPYIYNIYNKKNTNFKMQLH